MSPTSEIAIRRASDLRILLSQPNVRFKLSIDALGADNELWEERLRKDHGECGCSAGALGLLAGLAIGAAGALLAALPWWCVSLLSIGTGLAGLVLAKTLRQAAAKGRLRRNIAQLEDAAPEMAATARGRANPLDNSGNLLSRDVPPGHLRSVASWTTRSL